MSNVAVQQQGGIVPQTEEDLIRVLQNSLYPGAQIGSVQMVLGYCQAAGLDPMQKPVHIVPMWDSKSGSMRDVIMPGVNLYRTQASRTGRFAGMSDPEFGPMLDEILGGASIRYPEYCRVVVKRMLDNGTVAEFSATEYWIENYAMKGGKEKSIAPNAMWMKRPRGQIAKCAEAQALRKAFPECGAQPTAEEMEGKNIGVEVDITPGGASTTQSTTSAPEASADLVAHGKSSASKGIAAYQKFWQEAGAQGRKSLAAHHEGWKADATAADQERTVDAEPVSNGKKTLSADMQTMLDDLKNDAAGGVELFGAMWERLSDATKDALSDEYPKLMAIAEAAGGAK